MAWAGKDNPIAAKLKEATSKDLNFMIRISPTFVDFETELVSPNLYSWVVSFMQAPIQTQTALSAKQSEKISAKNSETYKQRLKPPST